MFAPSLVWFRQDLRLSDNPALSAALAGGGPVVCIFIEDDTEAGDQKLGRASKWWLHNSLTALSADLERLGNRLILRQGAALEIIPEIAAKIGAKSVFWNRMYEPWSVARDSALKAALTDQGIQTSSFNASLLHEPWTIKTKTGGLYSVFTPFWRALQAAGAPAVPTQAPTALPALDDASGGDLASDPLAGLNLLPSAPGRAEPNWAAPFEASWQPGEAGAQAALNLFLDDAVNAYSSGRDIPGTKGTSRLSAHLHFGEISPGQVWHATEARRNAGAIGDAGAWSFLREIGWRDFNRHLLFNNPHTVRDNFRASFDAFPWQDDPMGLRAWQQGRTGVPFVDAGMRELWQTGYMHNRVRMVAASFLVKHLLIDWRQGEAWFRDTLVDADLANNIGGWQWTAGCGADAAPYFRIFNPFTQGEKFDPKGTYTRKFLPELADLPDKWLHRPWEAPKEVLTGAGVVLGRSYPYPIVDHGKARERALAAYQSIKSASTKKVA